MKNRYNYTTYIGLMIKENNPKPKKSQKKVKNYKSVKKYDSYKEYLKSKEWKKLRRKVLARANRTCELCKMKKATQVHHKTYKRIFNERLTDLVAVCGICHLDKHKLLTETQLENAVNKLMTEEGYR